MNRLKTVQKKFRGMARPRKAAVLRNFFKTGPGEYAEGDRFLGITTPKIRTFARGCRELTLNDHFELLKSPFHEERVLALVLLTNLFKTNTRRQAQIYRGYLKHTRYLNNWDFVDISAPHIVGAYLSGKSRAMLYRLAESKSLWERRIAIVSTLYFIRGHDLSDTFKIAEKLLRDEEDLIHKASGWMLREAAKKNQPLAEKFLKKHCAKMPRTMLRYAIERFPETQRKAYLRGAI